MAYAEMDIGTGKATIAGQDIASYQRERDHMTMESFTISNYDYHSICNRFTRFEWIDTPEWIVNRFAPLGGDIQSYMVTWGTDESETSTSCSYWRYACGETKARIERDFNEMVAPVIVESYPQLSTKRKVLKTHGLIDPRVDRVLWPRWPNRETPPAIDLGVKLGSKTMPIEATLPFVKTNYFTLFKCRMRYAGTGALKKAECCILRDGQWDITVSFSPKGKAKISKAVMA